MATEEGEQGGTVQSRERPCSIEVHRNAKGEYAWSVKAYHEPGEHEGAILEICEVEAKLRDLFLRGGLDRAEKVEFDHAGAAERVAQKRAMRVAEQSKSDDALLADLEASVEQVRAINQDIASLPPLRPN